MSTRELAPDNPSKIGMENVGDTIDIFRGVFDHLRNSRDARRFEKEAGRKLLPPGEVSVLDDGDVAANRFLLIYPSPDEKLRFDGIYIVNNDTDPTLAHTETQFWIEDGQIRTRGLAAALEAGSDTRQIQTIQPGLERARQSKCLVDAIAELQVIEGNEKWRQDKVTGMLKRREAIVTNPSTHNFEGNTPGKIRGYINAMLYNPQNTDASTNG